MRAIWALPAAVLAIGSIVATLLVRQLGAQADALRSSLLRLRSLEEPARALATETRSFRSGAGQLGRR